MTFSIRSRVPNVSRRSCFSSGGMFRFDATISASTPGSSIDRTRKLASAGICGDRSMIFCASSRSVPINASTSAPGTSSFGMTVMRAERWLSLSAQ